MTETEFKTSNIKYHVIRYIRENASFFKERTVVDVPAGNGITSSVLYEIGAIPLAFDVFPEYFKVPELNCAYADVLKRIPLEDKQADALICQEGIEHFSDQFKVFCEFNRVLKTGGRLVVTTPNYSNLRSRMSYLLTESEHFKKIMPPNEFDSVWMNNPGKSSEIYFGHLFLLGAAKLRTLGKLSGFRIRKIRYTKTNTTSLLLFPFVYPFILVAATILYLRAKSKNGIGREQKQVYRELYRMNISPRLLLDGHLFFEFEKEADFNKVLASLQSVHREFGQT